MNIKKISASIVAGSLVMSLSLPLVVLAQDQATATSAERPKPGIFSGLRDKLQNIRGGRGAVREDIKNAGENLREKIKGERKELKNKMQAQRADIKDKIKDKREALKKKFGEKRLARIEDFAERMFKRFEAAIDRLNKTAERIGSRLDKISARGIDVSKQRASLQTARISITAAQASLEDAKTKLVSALNAADPQKSFKDVRGILETVRDALKKAHADLVQVITEIKKLAPPEALGGGNATSSTAATSTAQ